MTIGSISSANNASSLNPRLQIQEALDQAGGAPSGSTTNATASTNLSLSSFASILSQLSQIQQNNPTEFKEVTANIASTLQADASSATGSQDQALQNLADKFQQASQTGSMSSLEPSKSASGHGHHHSGVQSYSSQQSSSSSTNMPQDSIIQKIVDGVSVNVDETTGLVVS
jgi:hypothetical protein